MNDNARQLLSGLCELVQKPHTSSQHVLEALQMAFEAGLAEGQVRGAKAVAEALKARLGALRTLTP